MPAVTDIRLTVSHVDAKKVEAVIDCKIKLSPLDGCLYKLCPDSFNQEYVVHAGLDGMDFDVAQNPGLFSFPSRALEFQAGQMEVEYQYRQSFLRGTRLNEDPLPGQPDEIQGWVEIRTRLNGAQVSVNRSRQIVGLF